MGRLLVAVTFLAGVAACSSKTTAPAQSASAAKAASATGVSVGLSTPHTGSIKPTDLLQLRATASFADGTTGDCSEASTWTSSDPSVLKLSTDHPGQLTALAGGSAKITAKCGSFSADLALTVLGIAKVETRLPAGHASAFIMGEHSTLSSVVTFSDGTAEDCTSASPWTTSDAKVISVSPAGALDALAPGSVTVGATCRGVAASLPVSVRPGIRISGLEGQPFVLMVHPTVVLRADALDASGAVTRSCDAGTWTVADPRVLTLTPNTAGSGMQVAPHAEGSTTVSVSCGENAAILPIRVGSYVVQGTARSSSGAPIAGATVRALSNWGSVLSVGTSITDNSGRYAFSFAASPFTIIVNHPDFDDNHVSNVTWDRQPVTTADVTLTPVPGIFFKAEGRLCSNPGPVSGPCAPGLPPDVLNEARIAFHAPRAGTMQIRDNVIAITDFHFDDGMQEILTCNGIQVPLVGSTGLTYPADPTCNYVFYMRSNYHDVPIIQYYLTINMN